MVLWRRILMPSLAVAGLTFLVGQAPAQAPAAKPAPVTYAMQLALPSVKAPRNREGNPDFQGFWNRYPDLLLAPHLPNQPKEGDPLATVRRIPYPPLNAKYDAVLKEHWKKIADASSSNQPIAERQVNCVPDGMPNMMRAVWIMEIMQTPKQVNITQELYNQGRRVYMNEKLPSLDELDPGFFGSSAGHFEGQTLVIETIGIREDVMATSGAPGSSGGGDVPHSAQMKIVERIRYVAPDIIQNAITITDPETMTGPWTIIHHYRKMPADYRFQEYVCEANRQGVDETGRQQRLDVKVDTPPAR